MANNEELNKRASDMLDEENKAYRQEKFEKEMAALLKELAALGKELQEVQNVQKNLIAKYKMYGGTQVQLPYEVTDEQLADPVQLGDLDALEEMTKYYTECYENAVHLAKKGKFKERKYFANVSPVFIKAYDLTSKMYSKVNIFYNKYKDLIEAQRDAEYGHDAEAPEDVVLNPDDVIDITPKPVDEMPVDEMPVDEMPVDETPVPAKKKSNKPDPDKPGFLDKVDPEYYPIIFNILKDTVVIGNKYKYNTLDYLEYELQGTDMDKWAELGLPVDDPGKAALIRIVCLSLIKEAKAIRKDQWLSSKNDKKQGEFEGRKHTTQEAIIDRNTRLIKKLNIDPEVAAEYGLVTSLEALEKKNVVTENEKKLVSSVKDDPIFADFYGKFKTIYKLGSPTAESKDVLYSVYADLQKETNSFGLTGESLKAAKVLVEKTIYARRNSWQGTKEESKATIEEIQKDLGL